MAQCTKIQRSSSQLSRHLAACSASHPRAAPLARSQPRDTMSQRSISIPQQILYAQARATGAPIREGAAERLLARARRLLPFLGWTESRRREFLSLCDPSEQVRYWRRTLDTPRWRMAVDTLLSAWLLGLAYASPFVACLPRHFGRHVRARLERAWANHPNYSNPYVWRLFLGENHLPVEPPVACHSFCVCGRSHLLGDMRARELRRVLAIQHRRRRATILRAALVQSRKVRRRAGRSRRHAQLRGVWGRAESNWAARDRALLWGAVHVNPARDICSTF